MCENFTDVLAALSDFIILFMKSQEFSKQFLFQNKPNNDTLFVFSQVKIFVPNQYQHIFFQFENILQYLKKISLI